MAVYIYIYLIMWFINQLTTGGAPSCTLKRIHLWNITWSSLPIKPPDSSHVPSFSSAAGAPHSIEVFLWKSSTGWWFGTWLLFSHILGIIIPIDELIFFRGVDQPPTRMSLPRSSRSLRLKVGWRMRRPIRRWKACSWRVAMSRRSTSRQQAEMNIIKDLCQLRCESNR